MRQDRDGVWRAIVDLEPNRRYQFRYLIDGNWQTDYHADGWANNGFGSENSVVDTGLLGEGAIEDLDASATLLAYTETDSILEARVSASSAVTPKVGRGEDRLVVPHHPVRQRTAAMRHAA
jgi:hypothetical protein